MTSNVVIHDPKKDLFKENPSAHMVWSDHRTIMGDGSGRYLNYRHDRPISNKDCQKALDYIAVLTKVYPVQIRYAMARPLWERFCEAWCDSGDLKAAMYAI
jgi:hypothetical protein